MLSISGETILAIFIIILVKEDYIFRRNDVLECWFFFFKEENHITRVVIQLAVETHLFIKCDEFSALNNSKILSGIYGHLFILSFKDTFFEFFYWILQFDFIALTGFWKIFIL